MTAEIFKIEMPRRIFVFVSTQENERSEYLGRALGSIGAAVIGPHAYALSADIAPEAIRDALGGLEDGECVYLLGAAEGTFESHLLVPPRTEGGVIVR